MLRACALCHSPRSRYRFQSLRMNYREASPTKSSRGHFARGGIPAINELFPPQGLMTAHSKRGHVLYDMQRRRHACVMSAPIMEVPTLDAAGPTIIEPTLGVTPLTYFPTPYTDTSGSKRFICPLPAEREEEQRLQPATKGGDRSSLTSR